MSVDMNTTLVFLLIFCPRSVKKTPLWTKRSHFILSQWTHRYLPWNQIKTFFKEGRHCKVGFWNLKVCLPDPSSATVQWCRFDCQVWQHRHRHTAHSTDPGICNSEEERKWLWVIFPHTFVLSEFCKILSFRVLCQICFVKTARSGKGYLVAPEEIDELVNLRPSDAIYNLPVVPDQLHNHLRHVQSYVALGVKDGCSSTIIYKKAKPELIFTSSNLETIWQRPTLWKRRTWTCRTWGFWSQTGQAWLQQKRPCRIALKSCCLKFMFVFSDLHSELSLEEVDVLREVQGVLSWIANHVRVQHIVCCLENLFKENLISKR